jgi:hypothetical protein
VTAPDLIPVKVAAQRLGVSESTYRRAATAGQVPPIVKIRGVARVGVHALDRHIATLTLATPSASHGSAAVVEAPGIGGVGTPIHAGAGEQNPTPPTPQANGGTNE